MAEPLETPKAPLAPDGPHVLLLSGLSGGGKTAAAKLFEDLAYTVVDNLPGELLPGLAELVSADPARFARVAIVLDVRAGDAETAYRAMRGALEGRGIRPQVFFLEASDEVLVSRELCDALRADKLPQLVLGRTRRRRVKGLSERIEVCPVRRA